MTDAVKELDLLIETALDDLKVKSGPDVRFYGKDIGICENQERILAVLSFLLPAAFVRALNLIEGRRCQLYIQAKTRRRLWIVDDCFVFTSIWTCSCSEFCTALYSSASNGSRWKRACCHLVAATLLEKRYPFLPYDKGEKLLELDDFVDLFRVYRAPTHFR